MAAASPRPYLCFLVQCCNCVNCLAQAHQPTLEFIFPPYGLSLLFFYGGICSQHKSTPVALSLLRNSMVKSDFPICQRSRSCFFFFLLRALFPPDWLGCFTFFHKTIELPKTFFHLSPFLHIAQHTVY